MWSVSADFKHKASKAPRNAIKVRCLAASGTQQAGTHCGHEQGAADTPAEGQHKQWRDKKRQDRVVKFSAHID